MADPGFVRTAFSLQSGIVVACLGSDPAILTAIPHSVRKGDPSEWGRTPSNKRGMDNASLSCGWWDTGAEGRIEEGS